MLKLFLISIMMIFIQVVYLSQNISHNNEIINLKRKAFDTVNHDIDHSKKYRHEHENQHFNFTEMNSNQPIAENSMSYNQFSHANFSENNIEQKDENISNLNNSFYPFQLSNDTQFSNHMQYHTNNEKTSAEQHQIYSTELQQYQNTTDAMSLENCDQEANTSSHTFSELKNCHQLPLCIDTSVRSHSSEIFEYDTSSSDSNVDDEFQNTSMEQKILKLTRERNVKQRKFKMIYNRLRRQNLSNNRIVTMDDNYKFIKEISTIFTIRQSQLIENELQIMCRNLKPFLLDQIHLTNFNLNDDISGDNRALPSRNNKIIFKLINLCPFCKTQKLDEKETEKIEKKLIDEFENGVMKSEIRLLFKQLFHQIRKSYEKPFTIEDLFLSRFFLPQRIIIESMLKFFDLHKIGFGLAKRKEFLHHAYHRMFFENIEMKIYFLPELQSIIHVLLRTSSNEHLISKNRNFLVAFYSLYSLDLFFNWISKFYEQNKIYIDSPGYDSLRFVFQSISFIARICFVEPLSTLMTLHKNANMRYNFLIFNIYNNEILVYLRENNNKHIIAMNSYKLLPIIFLIEKHTIHNHFDFYLEFNLDELIQMNIHNIKNFMRILNFIKNTNIANLGEKSKELESFLNFHFFANQK